MMKIKKINLIFWASLLAWLIFFFSKQDEDSVLNLLLYLSLLAYGGFAVNYLWRFFKKRSLTTPIPAIVCIGVCCITIWIINVLHLSLTWPKEVLPVIFSLLAILTFWGAIVSYLKNSLRHIFLAEVLVTLSATLTILFIANYVLPKPLKTLDFGSVYLIFFFCLVAIFMAIVSRIYLNIGNTGLKKIIPSSMFRMLQIISLFMIGNFFYQEYYSPSPANKSCQYPDKNISIPDSPKNEPSLPYFDESLAEITIPKGGSLCGTLGMPRQEAYVFAKKNKMKYWIENGILYVLVQPGDVFFKTASGWQR